jgi:hypothetical protein
MFLPGERGGLGCLKPTGLKPFYTSFQRRFATANEFFIKKGIEESVVEPQIPHGIIEENRSKLGDLPLFHIPNLALAPKIGPLKENSIPYAPRTLSPIPLAQGMNYKSEKIYRFVSPRGSDKRLKMVRNNTAERMGNKKIEFWPWQLVEQVYPEPLIQEE